MREYTILMRQGAFGLEWEHKFTMASDKMARDYVHKLAETMPSGTSLWLHSPTKSIAQFDIGKPHVEWFFTKLEEPSHAEG